MGYTLCKVTVSSLNIRKQPTRQSDIVARYPLGTVLNFVEVVKGESVQGNPRWGHSQQGHYFWLGGTDHPNESISRMGGVLGDDYPYRNAVPDGGADEWGFFYRECTSFVAWRMNHQYGIPFQNNMGGKQFGNAEHWASNARVLGYRVDDIPSIGAIAQWGASVNGASSGGHVALVAQINAGNTITVEEYNWGQPSYHYGSRQIARTIPSCYIHIVS